MRRTVLGIVAGLVLGLALTARVSAVRGQSADGETAWVPDIERIYTTALGNVFDAAGEKFTDPELKAFYDRLTGEITDSLSTPVAFDPGIVIPTPTPVPTAVPTPVPTAVPTPEPTPQLTVQFVKSAQPTATTSSTT
ncbi:MAG: hypothetical protein O3C69_03610 [Chloroflexi bacterium]|nr:hypothetical protein [Chloroflexota bacterium]